MKIILLIFLHLLIENCFSQKITPQKVTPIYTPDYSESTNLTCQLLDTLATQIDSSIKLLVIDGDIYSDNRFTAFVKQKKIPDIFIRACDSPFIISPAVKTMHIEIKSNPFSASITTSYCSLDCTIGVFNCYLTAGEETYFQKWLYDNKKKSLIRITD